MLVLEELEHARARGAEVLGEIVGFGQSADAYHMTAPAPDGVGACLAMRQALEDGGLTPADVDYVNANGTSTPAGDAAETKALKDALGDHARSIVAGSTKSMTGHPLGAAGAIDAVISMLVCQHGVIPPTINFEEADPECDLEYAHRGPLERSRFGGAVKLLRLRRTQPPVSRSAAGTAGSVKGGVACHMAALCREHGISAILTNDRDFARFEGLEARYLGSGGGLTASTPG